MPMPNYTYRLLITSLTITLRIIFILYQNRYGPYQILVHIENGYMANYKI